MVALDEAGVREPHFPALRAGIHTGPALYRVGDYVGHTVNVASRIAAVARPNEIVVTEPVATAAREAGVTTEPLGPQRLAGVEEPVDLWRLAWIDASSSEGKDPVCGMVVGEDAAAHLVYGGIDYSFCSPDCLRRFIDDPDRYVRPRPAKKS
jgi:adenylate cyclase